MTAATSPFPKREPQPGEKRCPYDGIAYNQVPGYVDGFGCPICKGISDHHLPVPIGSFANRIIEAEKGMRLYEATQQAVEAARKQGVEVTLRFNEVDLHVHPSSWPADIAAIFWLKKQLSYLQKHG